MTRLHGRVTLVRMFGKQLSKLCLAIVVGSVLMGAHCGQRSGDPPDCDTECTRDHHRCLQNGQAFECDLAFDQCLDRCGSE